MWYRHNRLWYILLPFLNSPWEWVREGGICWGRWRGERRVRWQDWRTESGEVWQSVARRRNPTLPFQTLPSWTGTPLKSPKIEMNKNRFLTIPPFYFSSLCSTFEIIFLLATIWSHHQRWIVTSWRYIIFVKMSLDDGFQLRVNHCHHRRYIVALNLGNFGVS